MHRHSSTQLAFGIIAVALLALAGCNETVLTKPVDLAPLATQMGNLADANADLRAANERLTQINAALQAENERLKAMLRADADAGLAANAKGWLLFEGHVWRHQLTLLPGVEPDAVTAAKWTEASGLYAAGGEAAMQGVIDSLHSDATEQATKLGELSTRVTDLTSERDAAQKTADEALQRAQKAEQDLVAAVAKAVADEDARIAAETRAWQARAANWFGGGLLAAALACAAAAFLLPVSSKMFKEAAAVAFALCVGCFAFARFLSWHWFLPVVGGAYAVIGAIWWAWKIRTGIREREKAKVARDNAKIVADLVPMIDDYYDNQASPEAKADMAAKLFPALQAKGGAYDAAVKRFKAADCESRPPVELAKSDAAL